MILLRYFAKEVYLTMLAVVGIVLVIALAWRFSGYLEQAARGIINEEILLALMLYRVPGFLELILPVGFFLAVILAYGRLHVDSEMIVLRACGLSQWRITRITLLLAALVMAATAALALWLKPLGERQVEALLASQASITELATLQPGRFQTLGSGRRATYVEALPEAGRLSGIFINDYRSQDAAGPLEAVTLTAASGVIQLGEDGQQFLVMRDGVRYRGRAGEGGYQIIRYQEYGQLVERGRRGASAARRTAIPSLQLLGAQDRQAISELHWRLAVVLLTPVLALLAVPLAKVEPRQGRHTRLVPALALCLAYLMSLSAARAGLEKGSLPLAYGLWWLHGIFLLVAAALYWLERRPRRLLACFRRR